MPDESNMNRDVLAQRAASLKQRDKLKIFNLLIDAYQNHLPLEARLEDALKWSALLCDPVRPVKK